MIIGFSGRKQSGKDTSGSIAQILLNSPHLNNVGVKDFLRKQVDPDGTYYSKWEIKKFADKLKDMVCLLIGCTREQLENEEFKETPLDKSWNKWEVYNPTFEKNDRPYKTFATPEEAQECVNSFEPKPWSVQMQIREVQMTPRLLLQLIGTECGRNILHPNIWVNSTMADYKAHNYNEEMKGMSPSYSLIPNWIITDMRFPNELSAIKDRKGITIRVNRKAALEGIKEGDYIHPSETALDDATFDYVIDNDGTFDELIDTIREILQKEGLLTKD